MAKGKQRNYLNRLANKSVMYHGKKFYYEQIETVKELTEFQQGRLLDKFSSSIDYLILDDLSQNKTLQQKVATLNAKGASIQVLDFNQFEQQFQPTDDDLWAVIQDGKAEEQKAIFGGSNRYGVTVVPHLLRHADLRGWNVAKVKFNNLSFQQCDFSNATLSTVEFQAFEDCDFTGAALTNVRFNDQVIRCNFASTQLTNVRFSGHRYNHLRRYGYVKIPAGVETGVSFVKAALNDCIFGSSEYEAADYAGAKISNTNFYQCRFHEPLFARAKFENVSMVACKLTKADFTNADLTGTNLAFADLTGAIFHGANLQNVNLRGANLTDVDFSKAKNLNSEAKTTAALGPALQELDQLHTQTKWMHLKFRVYWAGSSESKEVSIASDWLKHSRGVDSSVPGNPGLRSKTGGFLFSDALLYIGNSAGLMQVDWDSIEVTNYRCPLSNKALWALMVRGIGEAMRLAVPTDLDPNKAAAASKAKRTVAKKEREAAELTAAKAKAAENKKVAKKIKKDVGYVNDVATFLKALELRIEKAKIDRATKMLKTSGYKLYHDVTNKLVRGIVKSRSNARLVNACQLSHDGEFSCGTQNLHPCGGLQGSICKHLLALIIGLVQAGELNPTTIDRWVAKSQHTKAKFDKEALAAIFVKYKGAEVGELDWRPIETLPEDYYAL